MWRAAQLESRLYAEVAFDPGANRQAIFLFVAVGVPFFLVFLVLALVYMAHLYSPWPPSLLSQL